LATWPMFPAAGHASLERLQDFDDILARWVDAEGRGDADALESILDAAFQGDGPNGYVLTKQEWLDRYRSGDLATVEFSWHGTETRAYGDTAVVMGIQSQVATYRGQDHSGDFQATLVGVRRDDRWTIVNVQLTKLAQSPEP
jgi:ketosteroid isomerase-like protein